MVRIFIAIVFIFCVNLLVAQQHNTILPSRIVNGDTIPEIWLEEAIVIRKPHNSNWYKRYQRRMSRLEYNVRKVYPYAQIAATRIQQIEQRLAETSKESERKKIVKEEYSELMKTFKAPLMKLSITQGRILIRLIYRETSKSSFSHIREYRGAVNAYFWQSLALLFGNNLKADYDPHGEDAEIEAIVQKILLH